MFDTGRPLGELDSILPVFENALRAAVFELDQDEMPGGIRPGHEIGPEGALQRDFPLKDIGVAPAGGRMNQSARLGRERSSATTSLSRNSACWSSHSLKLGSS